MATFTPPVIYSLVVGGLIFTLLARRAALALSRLLASSNTRQWVFRYLQAHILRRTRLTPPVSRLDLLMQLLYWGGTSCYNLVGAQTTNAVSQRAAAATAFNTIPLLLGDRLDFTADILNMSRRSYRTLHSTFGVMATAQLSLHVILQQVERKFSVRESNDRFALMVSFERSGELR